MLFFLFKWTVYKKKVTSSCEQIIKMWKIIPPTQKLTETNAITFWLYMIKFKSMQCYVIRWYNDVYMFSWYIYRLMHLIVTPGWGHYWNGKFQKTRSICVFVYKSILYKWARDGPILTPGGVIDKNVLYKTKAPCHMTNIWLISFGYCSLQVKSHYHNLNNCYRGLLGDATYHAI